VRRAEEAEVSGRRLRWLAERERKAVEAWERETSEIRGVVSAAGVSSVGELTDLLQRLQEARASLVDAQAGLADWEARAETKDAEAERGTVQQEIGELEHQLTVGTGGFVRDAQSIEAEIGRLESQPEAPAPAAAPVERPPAAPGGEPIRSLVERGSAELEMTPGAALRALQPRVGQLLPLLSAQRLGNLFADERGNLQVQSGGKMVAVSQLPPADRDLCFAVLKVGFLEQALVGGKGVAVIDDGLSVLPDGSRRIVARVLKQIAKGRQVVHVSQDPIFREAADHAG
jgi:DNA repair exonuclease SbcCD ATPase subunit